mgnify:CR=1 FL=1
MTGKDLIIFILQNNLVDSDIPIPDILVTEEQLAIKFGVGISTIQTWRKIGMLREIQIGESIFFLKNTSDPRIGGYEPL